MKKIAILLICLTLAACASTPSGTKLKRSPCAGEEAAANAGE